MANNEESLKHEGKSLQFARGLLKYENAILAIIAGGIVGVFSIVTKGANTTVSNIYNILIQSSIRGVAAIGQGLIILLGAIDLSVAGVATCATMIGGSMMTSDLARNIFGFPLSIYIAIPLVLLIGAGFGLANGTLVSMTGVPALIVTLGTWQISKGIAYQSTGGGLITDLPSAIGFIGTGKIGLVPIPIVIFFSIVGIGYFILHHTQFGRNIYAVGGNPIVAHLSGISVRKTVLIVFLMAGALYGVASILGMGRYMSSTMMQMQGLELDTIGAVLIGGISLSGGRGTIIGMLLGVLIIGIVNNGLSIIGASTATMFIAKGAIVITAVAIDTMRKS